MDSNFNFLEVYDNVLSKEECEKVIDDFEKVDPMSGRKVYGIQDSAAKKLATTLYCDLAEDLFDDFNVPVKTSLCHALPAYKNKYDFIKTLYTWRNNFLNAWDNITPLGFDDYFKRMWEFYLSYCEAGFKSKNIDLIQFSMSNR